MEFVTQIQLGTKGYLTVDQNVNVPLNFSVAEIQDISKKQGGFSKTIKLPGNSNNNILLGNLFDVNVTDASFNQNIKEQCIIIQNGVPVFNGFLQLTNVTKQSVGQGGLDDIITYDVLVKDDTGNFYQALDGGNNGYTGYLTDFDLSQYNHIYTLSAITATSAHTFNDVYKYHMMYNQKDYYEITDFNPSVFAIKYLDLIFSAIGYTYEWSGMTDTGFEKMIVPYNGDKAPDTTEDLEFIVGWSAATSGLTNEHNYGSTRTNTLTMDLNDDTSGILNDPNNVFNLSSNIYTSNYYGINTLKIRYNYEIYYYASQPLTLDTLNSGSGDLNISMVHIFQKFPSAVSPINIETPSFYTNNYPISTSLTTGLNFIGSGNTPELFATFPVKPGEPYRNVAKIYQYFNNSAWKDSNGNQVNPSIYIKVGIDPTNYTNNYFKDTPPKTQLNEGRTVILNNYIPKKYKWKSFISSLVKVFNLYLTPSKEKDNHIIFQTRDEFFDSGSQLDWSQKIDLSREHNIQFLPDLQDKNIILSWTKGSDLFSSDYVAQTAEIYGQIQYTFTNQFVQSIKTISPEMESTPLNETFSGGGYNIVSTINSEVPKTGVKLLYDCGWIPGNDWSFVALSGTGYNPVGSATTVFNGSTQGYPHCGHFYPNPIAPTDDLNFGLTDFLYYESWSALTNNNLYNKYYRRMINQIETGKMLTAYFRLNEYDILNLDFRDAIFIHDSYWFLNKIIDYNANGGDGLTKVELINVDEGIRFNPNHNESNNRRSKIDWSQVTQAASNELGLVTNIYAGGNTGVSTYGNNNIVQFNSNTLLVLGDNSNISGSKSIAIGDNNTLNITDSHILGNNNNSIINNSTVIGDNNTSVIDNSIIYGNDNNTDNITKSFVIGSNTQGNITNSFIFGDNNNIIASGITTGFTSGTTAINVIFGYNNTVASGITNAVIFGSDVTATTSNNIYIPTAYTINNVSINSITGLWSAGTGTNSIAAANPFGSVSSGIASVSEGSSTTASGNYSHSEGTFTRATGLGSHAEGDTTLASGSDAHAEGNSTTASGNASHAEGLFTIASGNYSHAGGNAAKAAEYGEWSRSSDGTGTGQYGSFDYQGTTVNNTITEIFLGDTATQQYNIGAGFTYRIDLTAVVKNPSNGDSKEFTGSGLIKNVTSTTSLVGTFVMTSVNGDASLTTTSMTITADDTNDALKVEVTGLVATNLNWYVVGEYIRTA